MEQLTYEWFGESFQFTEDDTDSLSLDALEWWPVILQARRKAQETTQGQHQRVQNLSNQNGPLRPGMKTPGSG